MSYSRQALTALARTFDFVCAGTSRNQTVQTIEQLEAMAADPGARHYIDKTFGGIDMLRMEILNDYFRHGFDGSGDDGGSCVDGRLTSTWNWCSRIEKKRFFHIFMLAGFTGFDGDWRVE